MTATLDARQATAPEVTAESLRREVRAVLDGPSGRRAWQAMLAARDFTGETDPRPVYRLLGAHRLLAANWPRAYGGRGLSNGLAAAVVEEMIAAGVPDTLHTLSVQICGTFLLSAGTAEQRAELLPGLAGGRRFCTVLYTEPSVGSDLSTLSTSAEPAPGGGWWLSGRKVYSVRTGLADLALVAARTEPRTADSTPYEGITLFLMPLDTPGVTVRTLPSLANEAFGDVTFDGAAAGPESVVGPVGGAWPLITGALALERTGVDHVAKSDAWLRAWLATADLTDPVARGEAGRLATRVLAARAMSRNCVADIERGRVDPVDAAATKLWCSETAQDVASTCAGLGHDSALWTFADPEALAGGRLEGAYREAPGLTISAGTSEMMLELVAGAGLPGTDISPIGESGPAAQLRGAVRAVCTGVQDAAVGIDSAALSDLAGLGVFGFLVGPKSGGTGLGMSAALIACEEAGAALFDGAMLDTLTAIDALAAAGPEHAATLAAAVRGEWRSALAVTGRPGRPVSLPDTGGLLVATGIGLPDGESTLSLLPTDHPGVTAVRRRAAAGAPHTVTLERAALAEAVPLCSGPAADAVLAGDLLRRAAWLTGLGTASVVHSVGRARRRRQFGRVLLDNQAVAFRLAELSVRARAIRALCHWLAEERVSAAPAGALAEAAEFARAAAGYAVQIHGAFGMVAGSPVAGPYRVAPLAIARGPALAALRGHAAPGTHRLKGSVPR